MTKNKTQKVKLKAIDFLKVKDALLNEPDPNIERIQLPEKPVAITQGAKDLYSLFAITNATVGIIDQLNESVGDTELGRLNNKLKSAFKWLVVYCQSKIKQEWHVFEREITERDVKSYTYVLGEMCEMTEDERLQVEMFIMNMKHPNADGREIKETV